MAINRDDLLRQIQNLTNLATHPATNPNEAAVAAAMATKLTRKYNVHVDELVQAGKAKGEKYDKRMLGRMDSTWNLQIASSLARYNFCKALTTTGKDPTRPDIWVVGQASNLDVVEYLYTYLLRTVRKLSRDAFAREHPATTVGKWDRAFGWGAWRAIDDKLEADSKGDDEQTTALVVVKDAKAREATEQMFGPLTMRPRPPSIDENARRAGYREGKNIQMRPGVETRNDRMLGGDK